MVDSNVKKIIHYDPTEAGRLHCDECGFDMPHKSAFTQALVGTLCPKCGADMLTQSDYDNTASMFRRIDRINRLFGPIFGRRAGTPGGQSMQMKIHGDEIVIKTGSSHG